MTVGLMMFLGRSSSVRNFIRYGQQPTSVLRALSGLSSVDSGLIRGNKQTFHIQMGLSVHIYQRLMVSVHFAPVSVKVRPPLHAGLEYGQRFPITNMVTSFRR